MSLSVRANGNRAQSPSSGSGRNEYKGCVIVTHDVEHEEGRDFCGGLMDLDSRYGIKSSFQVIPEERYGVSDAFLEGIRGARF